MASLKFKQGFDWTRVEWAGPRDPVSFQCSYCGRAIDVREQPLRFMGPTKNAVFCDGCVADWIDRRPDLVRRTR